MRIGEMVRSYMMQGQQAPQWVTADSPVRRTGTAQRANQVRLNDASKGLVQASTVREGVSAVSSSVGSARSLLTKAQGTSSATDRKQLQADFAKALAAVDQGVKKQSGALADTTLANSTYKAEATTVTAADQLGKGVSQQYGSLADLKKLDLSTATSEQLAEAAKVLDAAQSESAAQLATADAREQRVSGRVDTLQGVQDALSGKATLSARQQRELSAIESLSKQGTKFPPGSIFDGIG